MRSETSPLVVARAVELSLFTARSRPVPALKDFLQRAGTAEFRKALRPLVQFLGGASVRSRLANPSEAARYAADLLLELVCQEGIDPELLNLALDGAIWGGSEFVARGEPASPEHAAAWSEFLEEILPFWDFGRSSRQDDSSFPTTALTVPLAIEWPAKIRSDLFIGLCRLLETAIARGSLGDFCDIHFQVVEMLQGRTELGTPVRDPGKTLKITKEVEDATVKLARASVARVARWRQEGKTTEDLGWYGAIDGRESSRLITALIGVSHDRERLVREAAPLLDILADAGCTQLAAELPKPF